MFSSVLVANRGEIAVRVIRTLNALAIRSIAVYSDADAGAPHVELADEAVRIGPAASAESYLSIERILGAAKEAAAEAIHPGYGFLSESPAFARACADAGVVFVGPPPEATELLGDKVRAKLAAQEAGVPILPGLQRPGLTDEEILRFAEDRDRLPLMVKAAAGGGGRGMRIVRELARLPEALAAARREALAGFGDDGLLVERYVERARHIEVQLLADAHGTVLHLGERECSLQRRHQKVLEESPSPAVGSELRRRLGTAAVDIARRAGYVGAGTAEFLVPFDDPDAFAFLEVNARLQVEHPVTESVTDLDLVEQQLRIAAGEPLAFAQEDVSLTGHSVEVRVCAEDPGVGFLPATGRVVGYREPRGPGVRVDSGIRLGSEISGSYDSLLLKVIGSGHDREEALERVQRALKDLLLLGVKTNAGFLARLLAAPEVRSGELDTGLLERGIIEPLAPPREAREAAVAAAAIETLALVDRGAGGDPWDALAGWRMTGDAGVVWDLEPAGGGEQISVHVLGSPDQARVRLGTTELAMTASVAGGARVRVELDGHARLWDHAVLGADRWIAAGADAFAFSLAELVVEGSSAQADGALEAPMPGAVLAVRVKAGDAVTEGDVLVVVESMKMELTIVAPWDAIVRDVRVAEGDQVAQGQSLVELEGAAA
ncbi:MAG TPA: biotin carboxylase N-terminal domain-containing protein [Solirubrobacteraceae bacterium]|jgi:acetyl-CoA/propionyl-CoA carboxylase biotin carboxyl carrier protein